MMGKEKNRRGGKKTIIPPYVCRNTSVAVHSEWCLKFWNRTSTQDSRVALLCIMANPRKWKFIMNANWLHTTFNTLTHSELATTSAWENHHLNGSTRTLWKPLWLILKIFWHSASVEVPENFCMTKLHNFIINFVYN